MPRPFLEKAVRRSAATVARRKGKPVANPKRGVLGWVVFIATAVVMFLYIQSTPQQPSGPGLPAPLPTAPAANAIEDRLAIAAIAAGVLLIVGWYVYLTRFASRSVKILAWHFDESGVHTTQTNGEHFMSWEWIGNVTATRRGVLIERTVAPTRLFPNNAFENDAERQAFIEAYARNGIRAAKEVQDDNPRGFEVRGE